MSRTATMGVYAGTKRVVPREAYNSAQTYATNAVVTWGGRTWKATQFVPRGLYPRGDPTTMTGREDLIAVRRGYAETVTGGRVGAVLHVTNANASGAGSLKDTVEGVGTGGAWIVFDGDYTISPTTDIMLRPNTTIDGYGRNVTIKPQGGTIGLRFDSVAYGPTANIIVAYLTMTGPAFISATSPGQNNKAMLFGGGGAGQAGGGTDLVWIHHVSFSDFRDTPLSFGGFGGVQSRGLVDWCKFGPNPGSQTYFQNVTSGNSPSRAGKALRFGGDPEDTTEHAPYAGQFTMDRNLLVNCNVRQPFGNGTHVHATHNVLKKWGKPDATGSVGMNAGPLMHLRSHNNVFEPYVTNESHHWTTYEGSTVLVTTPDTQAVYAPTSANAAVLCSGNWLRNSATENPATRGTVFTPPYSTTLLTADAALQTDVEAGAGNVQPWELVG